MYIQNHPSAKPYFDQPVGNLLQWGSKTVSKWESKWHFRIWSLEMYYIIIWKIDPNQNWFLHFPILWSHNVLRPFSPTRRLTRLDKFELIFFLYLVYTRLLHMNIQPSHFHMIHTLELLKLQISPYPSVFVLDLFFFSNLAFFIIKQGSLLGMTNYIQ